MSDQFDDESWVPDEAISALSMESDLHPEESSAERAKRLLVENVDVAAAGMIWTARNSTNERLRADAQKYIMERVLGRAGENPATGAIEELFNALDRMNEKAAAMAQSTITPSSAGGDGDGEAEFL